MKRILLALTVFLLTFALLVGCATQPEAPITDAPATDAATDAPVDATEEAVEDTTAPVQEPTDNIEIEIDATDILYAEQIERYYTALSEKWEESTFFDKEMCALVASYYEGNPLDNVGYAFMDLDADGTMELIIGAILSNQADPAVFEIWTLKDDQPVMLVQSGARNRYFLQNREDGLWTIANDAQNGAANFAYYELQLSEGELKVVEGVIFDAAANEDAPWFMTTDLDWNVSNDTATDEKTADDFMTEGRNAYRAIEYTPYSMFQ